MVPSTVGGHDAKCPSPVSPSRHSVDRIKVVEKVPSNIGAVWD